MKNCQTIEIDNISIEYEGKEVLKNLSLAIAEGETIAVTGTSGCGKSTLLKAVMGFVPTTAGTIKVGGTPIGNDHCCEARKHISYLSQDITFPCEYVHEIAEMVFSLRSNRNCNRRLFGEYLKKLSLDEEITGKRLSEISGGQRQRIMIALTAALQKPFLLLDEPTSALDEESCGRVVELLRTLPHRPTVMIVTHSLALAASCDRYVNLTPNEQ